MLKDTIPELVKQAHKMQEKMQEMQEELVNVEVIGESGAGLVKIKMNGRHYVKQVILDDSLMEEDKEVIEDLIASSINNATSKIEDHNKVKMSSFTDLMQKKQ